MLTRCTQTQVLHARPLVQVPRHWLPLLPCRHVLLRQLPPRPQHLVLPTIQAPLHKHVLFSFREQRCSHSHVAEQPRLPLTR